MPETNPLSSSVSSSATPFAAEVPSDLARLSEAIGALPPEHAANLIPLLERVVESTGRRRRILSLVQDALGQLRLDMKYLMFDLEATRRERDAFQQKLNECSDSAEGDDA
ncbi:transcriptional regulator [Botrimarina hoheduenensis]|uniref:Uncharacterized protein n=1 Tax=Botrimarina hoheduenensis TaxID=2528000 RepID=A0A5C5WEQ8_9BACT|nr:transcriptional regulator [Botrimarina hoheduenensis]TWT48561.1 hypothetical protein Pla111_03340 [Botrimarina hoheduenensis]